MEVNLARKREISEGVICLKAVFVPSQSHGKISAQPHTTLCSQFLNRENNDKNNTFPLGKQICFTIVWGCAETLPLRKILFQMCDPMNALIEYGEFCEEI